MSDTILLEERSLMGTANDVPAGPPPASHFSDLIATVFGPASRSHDKSMGTAVLFTGLDRGSGVSHACASIAAELSQRPGKVLLADAEAVLALAGRPRPSSFCERVEQANVWVLGIKQTETKSTATALGASTGVTVLDSLRREFACIILDAPALSVNTVALTLGAAVTGVVLVVPSSQVERRRLAEAQRMFRSLGARLLGSIYNAG